MRFIAISILLVVNIFNILAVNAQADPQVSRRWTADISPKIKNNFDKKLRLLNIKPSAKTIIYARAYLEKNGSIRNLRITKDEEESDMKKADLVLIEKALLSAIKESAPLPYKNNPNSLWKHLGLYVRYESATNELEAGMTRPEDFPV